MKLLNLVLTVLPVLALATPTPTVAGIYYRGVDNSLGSALQQDQQPEVPEDGGQEIRGTPTLQGYFSTDRSDEPVEFAEGYERLSERDLEARDDVDHYLEECNSSAMDKKCIYNLIVPKGQGKGVCSERIQKDAFQGTMHILDKNIMCKYYTESNCKGSHSGPFSNQELDYSGATYRYNQVVGNPQSFFCQNIGFQKPNVPVKPPSPVPTPDTGYSPFLDYALAHSCPWTEVDTGNNCYM